MKNTLFIILLFLGNLNSDFLDLVSKSYEDGNINQVVKLYEIACYSEDFKACLKLGILYEYEGYLRDYVIASKFYKKACEADYLSACNKLDYLK